MSARIGVVLVRSTTWPRSMSPETPSATPMSALSIVMPAATSEPKVMSRTTRATATPRPSVEPTSGSVSSGSPPAATLQPAGADCPSCSKAVRSAAVSLSEVWSYWTPTSAYRPSGLTARVSNGLVAATTPGSAEARWTTD